MHIEFRFSLSAILWLRKKQDEILHFKQDFCPSATPQKSRRSYLQPDCCFYKFYRVDKSISARTSHRTVRNTLALHSSYYSTVGRTPAVQWVNKFGLLWLSPLSHLIAFNSLGRTFLYLSLAHLTILKLISRIKLFSFVCKIYHSS